MANVLIAAVDSEDADTLSKARHVVELITGGAIYLTQAGERLHGRGWLVGTFQPRLVDAICRSFDPHWSLSVRDDVSIVTIEHRRERSAKDLQVKMALHPNLWLDIGCFLAIDGRLDWDPGPAFAGEVAEGLGPPKRSGLVFGGNTYPITSCRSARGF